MRLSTDQLLLRVAGAIGLVALAFSQQPGRVVADTKLDLVVDPGAFLHSSLSAWDPQAGFGQLQNQAYGYLFPMGSTFWAGHALGLPDWVVQRTWWSMLLVVAYSGFLLLADRLGVGRPGLRAVGALAYALGPRVLTVLGPISAEALPLALLPWVLIPLVTGSRTGSPRRAAALSALAVACIGGINAAATLAVLVVPLLWLLTRERGSRRRALTWWWAGCTVLAVAWWFIPLLVLGRYAFPFLDTIETSRTTTSVTSLSNVLRGADHWVGFLVREGAPAWPAGWTVATGPWTVAATAAVAVLGLWGLRAGRLPEALFLRAAVLAGCVFVAVGYTGTAGSPLGPWVQSLLDGPLAAFRNVHKFDPVLRLPLTLGLTVALGELPRVARRLVRLLPGEEGEWLRRRPRVAPVLAAVALLGVLAVASSPAWTGRLPNEGAFESVPTWWDEAASWLGSQDGRTLLEPASGFGEYDWGRPWDEPLQALAQAPWAVRAAAPLGSPGLTRYLDAVEQEISTGRPSDRLAPALARAGVRQVLLRNDLALWASATPVAVARATLQHSPGLRLVQSFGPPVQVSGTVVRGSTLEVYAVAASGDPRITTTSADEVAFTGGPEALVRAGGDPRPWLDPTQTTAARSSVVTDTLPDRQLNVGAPVTQDSSEMLDGSADSLGDRPLRDIDPYGGAAVERSVVRLEPEGRVSVSSTTTDPYLADYRGPVGGPYATVDGSTSTAWVPSFADARPTWRLQLPGTRPVPALDLDFTGLPSGVIRPARVVVTTNGGSTEVDVSADRVRVPLGTSSSSIGVALVRSVGVPELVGVSEIAVEGMQLRASEQVADPPAGTAPSWSFAVPVVSRPSCIQAGSAWTCSSAFARQGAEDAGVDRSFSSTARTQSSVSASVVAVAGPALDRLLDAASGTIVAGSSRRFPDAVARPGAALDGDSATAWVPAASDSQPSLSITLPRAATVRGVAFVADAASNPAVTGVVVRDGSGNVRSVSTDGAAMVPFEPLTSDRFDVTFRLRHATDPSAGVAFALSELQLDGLQVDGAAPYAPRVVLPCRAGPTITVDGDEVRTGIDAAAVDLVAGRPVPLHVCDGPIGLDAGSHRLQVVATPTLAVTQVDLGPTPATGSAADPAVQVLDWGPDARSVLLAPSSQPRVLMTTEGANAGWRATLGNEVLTPVQVDGWRQAWRVPAGAAGQVDLVFGPNAWHRAGLVVGGGLLVVLLLLALPWRGGSGTPPPPSGAASAPRYVLTGLGLGCGLLVAGLWGLLAWVLARWLSGRRAVWAVAAGSWVVLVGAAAAGWIPLTVATGAAVLLQVLAVTVLLSVAPGPVRSGARHRTGGPD